MMQEVKPTERTFKQVLLVTYTRGGSSLLGVLFNWNPEAFYWFEPLAAYYSRVFPPHQGIENVRQ